MKFSAFLKGFVVALGVYLIAEYVWHHVLLMSFYEPRLAAMASTALPPTSLSPLIIVAQVMVAAATSYFVLRTSRSCKEAAMNGAFIGLVMVGTVNFVNHSLLANWDMALTLVDTGWGILLGGLAGVAVHGVAGKA